MAALDKLGAFLDALEADAAAARQPEIDAAVAALAQAQATDAAVLADLQARYDAYVAKHPDILPTFTVKDFAVQSSGWFYGSKSMTTPGRYSMVPFSSTKSTPTSGTNQNRLMRFGSMSASSVPAGLEYGNFVLEGTVQGHEYGGILLGYSKGAYLHDIGVSGCPGSSSAPPGEVALLDIWHAVDARLVNITLDGRRVSDGAQVGSSLLEHNKTTGTAHTADNLTAIYAQFGFGAAIDASSSDITFTNCLFGHSRKAVNVEHAMGGSVTFRGCKFTDIWGAAYIAQVSSIVTGGKSCRVTFEDCEFDSVPQARVWTSSTNNQLESDIRRIINGRDVTADPSKFLLAHTG